MTTRIWTANVTPQEERILSRVAKLMRAHDLVELRLVCEEHRSLVDASDELRTVFKDRRPQSGKRADELADLFIELGLFGLSRMFSALDTAVMYDRPDLVLKLLAAGAPVDNLVTSLWSPLHRADLDCTKMLVEAGADVDRDDLTDWMFTPLSAAEDPHPESDAAANAELTEYLRSVGATKPWDFARPNTFWDGVPGEYTTLLLEGSLGLVAGPPLLQHKTAFSRFDVRRARYGWRKYTQALFTSGMTDTGGPCELAVVTHSLWPTHREAMKEQRFRAPVDFLAAVGERVLASNGPQHGDVLDRDHPLVGGLTWPGEFQQWLVVEHASVKNRAAQVDPNLPKVLFLIPHLDKKPLKPGADAKAKADFKANVKWEKPAMKTGRNNLTIPLCYDAPWLEAFKEIL
jgi:hypothetical protein